MSKRFNRAEWNRKAREGSARVAGKWCVHFGALPRVTQAVILKGMAECEECRAMAERITQDRSNERVS